MNHPPVLRDKRVYISGPIEFDTNDDWRTPLIRNLRDHFGMQIFDPLADSKQSKAPELHAARERRDYEKMREIAHTFVHKDLGLVDRMDLIIARVPHKVPTIGTVHEIINSNNAKKPTLLVCPQGKHMVGLWYFGFIPHRHMFGSNEELFAYLQEVNEWKHTQDARWAFVYDFPDVKS